MSENISRKGTREFLTIWSILNLVGWIIGLLCVFLIQMNLEYNYKFSMSKSMLVWLPFGASIGVFQWIKLKHFEINFLTWSFATAFGWNILITLYSWVLNFGAYEYRQYNIPDWLINSGLALTLPLGGAVIGSIQSFLLKKHNVMIKGWIRAYAIGLLLPAIIAPLAFSTKSFFLSFLYSNELYSLVDMRWFLFFSFLIISTAVFTSILTGNILLKQSNIKSLKIKVG